MIGNKSGHIRMPYNTVEQGRHVYHWNDHLPAESNPFSLCRAVILPVLLPMDAIFNSKLAQVIYSSNRGCRQNKGNEH